VLAASAGSATAEMDDAFGNTVLSRYADGGWVKHWFEPDGRYRAEFSSGRQLTARWRIEGDKVCLNQIRPSIMMISRFCSPLVQARVGQTWPSRDPLGRRVQNVLVAGR
jgi:hypothetical protein